MFFNGNKKAQDRRNNPSCPTHVTNHGDKNLCSHLFKRGLVVYINNGHP